MTGCSHPSKTSCHSQAELTKQSRAAPPTHCTDLPKGNIRGQKDMMFGVKAFTRKLSRDVQKMLSFPC